jgi:hypothetical protein
MVVVVVVDLFDDWVTNEMKNPLMNGNRSVEYVWPAEVKQTENETTIDGNVDRRLRMCSSLGDGEMSLDIDSHRHCSH